MSEIEFDENNPMLEPMVNKPYTQEFVDNITEGVEVTEEPLPEAKYIKPPLGEGTEKPSETTNSEGQEGVFPPEVPEHFAQMSASERRTNAEKTANTILINYQQVMPLPFVMISNYNMRKMKKLHNKGEINLEMIIRPDNGTTTGSYMESHNDKVAEVFQIGDDMAEELRDPLIDVLMEKGMVASPTTRLLMAVGGHVAKMSQIALQMYYCKQDDMEEFRRFRADEIKAIKEGRGRNFSEDNNNEHVNNNQNTNRTPPPPEEKIATETQPSASEKNNIEEEMVAPPITSTNKPDDVSLGDYLNSGNDDSIEIEEVDAEEVF